MKKILINLSLLSIIGITVYLAYFYDNDQTKVTENVQSLEEEAWFGEEEPVKTGDPNFIRTISLDVPLENQFEGIVLENGCEITSLSMLLQYYGFEVNKNQLAKLLDYVPYALNKTTHGNPDLGFVGDIKKGNEAMGVHVDPIAKVAKQIVNEEFEVVAGKGRSFQDVLQQLQADTPVWILATLEMTIPSDADFISWQTKEGEMQVTPLIHSVVLTGMDAENVYYNDPSGIKDARVSIADLEDIYNKMGKQSLFLK